MYVTQRGDKFRAWERVVIDGKVKKISVTMEKNTAQARKKAADLLRKKASVPTSDITFSDLCDRYIEDQEQELKKRTTYRNRKQLDTICSVMGRRKVCTLSAGVIRHDLITLADKPQTRNEYLVRVKACIRWAFKNDYINSTTCIDKIDPWEVQKKNNDYKYLEREELAAVIDAASPFYGAIIEFLALTGLRIGELIALEDDDVTLTEIHVTKNFDTINKITTTPKTDDSMRTLYVQPELQKTINRLRKLSNLHRARTGSRSKLFVVARTGQRLVYKTFSEYCGRLTEKVTGRRLTPHALRHTHVSLLAEAGVPLETISRRLGHNDSAITREIYLHVTKTVEARDRELLKNVSFL